MMDSSFKDKFLRAVKETEDTVYAYLPKENGFQKTIFTAMNYSVKAGGKRLRPLLMRETYRMFGGKGKEIEPFMAAIEMIHTFPVWITTSFAGENRQHGRYLAMIWQFWPETH